MFNLLKFLFVHGYYIVCLFIFIPIQLIATSYVYHCSFGVWFTSYKTRRSFYNIHTNIQCLYVCIYVHKFCSLSNYRTHNYACAYLVLMRDDSAKLVVVQACCDSVSLT